MNNKVFISPVETAELCGVTEWQVQRDTVEDDTSGGLSPKTLFKVARIHADQGNVKAIALLDELRKGNNLGITDSIPTWRNEMKDFLVTKNGAFISQRKTAEMVGIDRRAIQKFISSSRIAETLNDGMLTPKTLVLVATHYAYVSKAKTEKALLLHDKLMEAGAKAFILYSAGQQPVTHHELEAKILKLEKQHTEDLAKIIANPRPTAIKSRHEELMGWVNNDWLHVEKKQITKYVYTILDTQVLTKTKTGMIVKL